MAKERVRCVKAIDKQCPNPEGDCPHWDYHELDDTCNLSCIKSSAFGGGSTRCMSALDVEIGGMVVRKVVKCNLSALNLCKDTGCFHYQKHEKRPSCNNGCQHFRMSTINPECAGSYGEVSRIRVVRMGKGGQNGSSNY